MKLWRGSDNKPGLDLSYFVLISTLASQMAFLHTKVQHTSHQTLELAATTWTSDSFTSHFNGMIVVLG